MAMTSGSCRRAARRSAGEGFCVLSDFPLADDGHVVAVDVLDGVLDGDDMFSLGVVDVVDHAGHGGGLAFASGAGDEDESFSGVGHPGYDFGGHVFRRASLVCWPAV